MNRFDIIEMTTPLVLCMIVIIISLIGAFIATASVVVACDTGGYFEVLDHRYVCHGIYNGR